MGIWIGEEIIFIKFHKIRVSLCHFVFEALISDAKGVICVTNPFHMC